MSAGATAQAGSGAWLRRVAGGEKGLETPKRNWKTGESKRSRDIEYASVTRTSADPRGAHALPTYLRCSPAMADDRHRVHTPSR